jgi:hypothetical protein
MFNYSPNLPEIIRIAETKYTEFSDRLAQLQRGYKNSCKHLDFYWRFHDRVGDQAVSLEGLELVKDFVNKELGSPLIAEENELALIIDRLQEKDNIHQVPQPNRKTGQPGREYYLTIYKQLQTLYREQFLLFQETEEDIENCIKLCSLSTDSEKRETIALLKGGINRYFEKDHAPEEFRKYSTILIEASECVEPDEDFPQEGLEYISNKLASLYSRPSPSFSQR